MNGHRGVARWVKAPTLALVVAALPLYFSVAACQSSGNVSADSDATTVAASSQASGAAPATAPIDACAMLSAADISTLLGVTVQGVPNNNVPDKGQCEWTNSSTDESVSIDIGISGTAPRNVLPPLDPGIPDPGTPGPDGMRFMGGGAVEFAGGGRKNNVQVAVLRIGADQANSAAVDLARKIIPQLPS